MVAIDVGVERALTLRQRLIAYALIAAGTIAVTEALRFLFMAVASQPRVVVLLVSAGAGLALAAFALLFARFLGGPAAPPPPPLGPGGGGGCGGDPLMFIGVLLLALAPGVMLIWIFQPPPVQKRALRVAAVLVSFGLSCIYMCRHPHEYATLGRKVEGFSASCGIALISVELLYD